MEEIYDFTDIFQAVREILETFYYDDIWEMDIDDILCFVSGIHNLSENNLHIIDNCFYNSSEKIDREEIINNIYCENNASAEYDKIYGVICRDYQKANNREDYFDNYLINNILEVNKKDADYFCSIPENNIAENNIAESNIPENNIADNEKSSFFNNDHFSDLYYSINSKNSGINNINTVFFTDMSYICSSYAKKDHVEKPFSDLTSLCKSDRFGRIQFNNSYDEFAKSIWYEGNTVNNYIKKTFTDEIIYIYDDDNYIEYNENKWGIDNEMIYRVNPVNVEKYSINNKSCISNDYGNIWGDIEYCGINRGDMLYGGYFSQGDHNYKYYNIGDVNDFYTGDIKYINYSKILRGINEVYNVKPENTQQLKNVILNGKFENGSAEDNVIAKSRNLDETYDKYAVFEEFYSILCSRLEEELYSGGKGVFD